MFERILVAYHGTERALRAFDAAIQMAHRLDMPLHIVSVEENVPRAAELIAEVEDAKKETDARYRHVADRRNVGLHCMVSLWNVPLSWGSGNEPSSIF
jgi:nucleotide-binding universal stress UspA family protein